MSKLKGAALDRAVANAMGVKSVHNCEKWGEEHMTFWKPEYANIGGFGDPTARYPLGEEHMTGFQSKQAVAQTKLNDDDDIQDYKKPWVGLTDEEATEIYVKVQEEVNEHWDKGGTTMMFPTTLYKAIEQALKEKNT